MSDTTMDCAVGIVALRSDDQSGCIATSKAQPMMSWRMETIGRDVRQFAYELARAADDAFASGTISSGWIESSYPFGALPGAPLKSREVVWCRVRIRTSLGTSAWSDPCRMEGSLFEPEDWVARPVSPRGNWGRKDPVAVPLLRRAFAIQRPVVRARLYVSALGVHGTTINGQPVSDDLLEPGWTDYRHRLLFAAHDVTALLQEGENVIAASVGDGWWRGNLTWMDRRAVYGETTALLAQLEIEHADGTRTVVATDDSWRGATGGLLSADIYNGSVFDQRREPAGWRQAGFDDSEWEMVSLLPLPQGLEQRSAPGVRIVRALAPTIREPRPGWRGVVCAQTPPVFLPRPFRAGGEGRIVTRHAEVLDGAGNLFTAPLRSACASDEFRILPGPAVLIPDFTYHGFRFAEVAVGGAGTIEKVEGCVVASDLARTGRFACSDDRINRLFENIRWSQIGNFVAIPTDCPQRDERLGWTGDIQVFADTACANSDCRAFLSSWLIDLASEQAPDGRVTSTVPNVIQGHEFEFAGVGWSDAATLVPMALFRAHGDPGVLERQFPSMRRWVDWCVSRLGEDGTWSGDFHLGDWLDPAAPPDRPEQATTDRDLIASAYLVESTRAVACAARLLGHSLLERQYRSVSAGLAAATWRKWSTTLRLTQAGCAVSIMFGVVPEPEILAVGRCLAELVERNDGRIGTGFLGTPLVLPALTRAGEIEAAYRLLLNEEAPGWLYQVLRGATTVWERWDAIRPDGRIHAGEMAAEDAVSMTSFNHYAYGSVGAWLYASLAGIAPAPDGAGYRVIDFQPHPGGGLSRAEASVETPFGNAAIHWRVRDSKLCIDLEVPAGAEARLHLPSGWAAPEELRPLGSGRHAFVFPSSA